MRAVLALALALTLAGAPARADVDTWVNDRTTTVLTTRLGDATVTVRRREMPYGSGYMYVALTAIVARGDAVVRTALGRPGPTMCASVRAIAGGLESAICTERFADTRAVTRWTLDPATARLVAGPARAHSPYAATAARLVADLAQAGRAEAAREAAIDRLGPSPDGQLAITWWWSAHRLLARWPVIARLVDDDPDRAREVLRPHVLALLAPDDDGEPGAIAAIAAGDLRFVPRTHRDRRPPIAGPRPDLTAILVACVRLLRDGAADDRALSARLQGAVVAGAVRAVVAAGEG